MALPKSNGQIVLITGINGYIASRTAEAFLNAGYHVRGTARSKSSTTALLKALEPFVATNRLEIVEVPDITLPGAFDTAVEGTHAIAHLAAPISLTFTDPVPVLHAAIQGTLTILTSAYTHGSTLKSVVLMSSIAAILGSKSPPYIYTESDWNDVSEAKVAELGTKTPGGQIYFASKTAGEKAFWKFKDENKPSFSMTAVNPCFVGGPPLVVPDTPEGIHETVRSVYTILSGQPFPPALGGSGAFVDVRDVADLVLSAVQKPEVADGERYIACGGVGGEQQIADILRKAYPEREIVKGTPGKGYEVGWGFKEGGIVIDGSKAVKAMGKEWITYNKCVLDAAKTFEKFL